MPSVFYNESDSYVAQWLGNLVAAGRLPQTAADARSIVGGWLYALALAGWTGDREVWTGSCPCQRFWRSKRKAPPQPGDDDRKINERGRIMAARKTPNPSIRSAVTGAMMAELGAGP